MDPLRNFLAPKFWLLCCITALALATLPVLSARQPYGNETDQLALLEFKSSIVDHLGVLSSWNSSQQFCRWYGVTCGGRHQRVTALLLPSLKLSGTLSPYIGNLSFLRIVYLGNNSIHSRIPPEVGRLSRLRTLYLNNNSLVGAIPPVLVSCSSLVNIGLHFNMLEGNLPANLGSLSKLKYLSFASNELTGTIPLSVGNLSSLVYLSLSQNNLSGMIPDTIGQMRNLKVLSLENNNLVGNFPSSIFNMSSLEVLDLGDNQLVGILPNDLGIALPNIQVLSVGYNQLTGSIPKSVSNMSGLSTFQLVLNKFTGNVPSFGRMANLYRFAIGQNYLGRGKANDLGFLCSLTNSTNIFLLGIRQNNFGGSIPECISNLSTTLARFWLGGNVLVGSMPSSVGKFVNLETLSLSGNKFSGTIPDTIGNLYKMKMLSLDSCEFTGPIPYTLGNLRMMTHLYLNRNRLQSTIPSSLSKCQSLLLLDVSDNTLTGAIPSEIMSLTSLSISADFSRNSLTGELPTEIGMLKNLGVLRLSGNKLSGDIPSTLGGCISLQYLYLQENAFSGPVNSSLSSLKGIQELNLSHNKFSGQIPEFLKELSLTSLDLSFNNFSGHLPEEGVFANTSATYVQGNDKLCGGKPEYRLPKCTSNRPTPDLNVAIYTVAGVFALLLILCLLFNLLHRKQKRGVCSEAPYDLLRMVSYHDLKKATNGFSSANLIGIGNFGSVFRGVLDQDKTAIAVKVLHMTQHGALKSFIAECEALRYIKHQNLVKVITACSGFDSEGSDFKALVYEYMVNRSLDEWLHPEAAQVSEESEDIPRQLTLIQRVKIAIDVACALDYLHHQCRTPIIHCDLKPSNILLDGKMNGRVGDFGLVRFLPEVTKEFISSPTSSVGVRGSLGYIAPEYGLGAEVSTAGDVYSYGILILEMFTGKRPTDDMFIDGRNLHSFAKAAFPKRVLQIINPVLLRGEEANQVGSWTGLNKSLKIQECLVSILDIGIICSSEIPGKRMIMSDVVPILQAIREEILACQENDP